MEMNVSFKEKNTEIPIAFGTGSGGGSITGTYDMLKGKPKINNREINGNHDGTYYGLVNAIDGKGLSTNDYTNNEKEKVQNSLSNIAGVETGTTATKDYSINDLVVISNHLCVITANAPLGTVFSIGTNCEYTTIGDQLMALVLRPAILG